MGKINKKEPPPSTGMKLQEVRVDGWTNAINGLGSQLDPLSANVFRSSKQRSIDYWEDFYYEDPLAHRIALLPAAESLRQGFSISGLEGDAGKLVEAFYNDLEADTTLIEAMALARATGGCMVFLGADDGLELSEPLDPTRVRSFDYLKIFTRQQLQPRTHYQSLRDPKFGQPELYLLNAVNASGQGMLSEVVHESRFIRFEGISTTDRRRSLQQGWGDSIYVQMADTLSRMWGSVQGLSSSLATADQAVFKLKGLLDILRSNDDDLIRKRLGMMNHGRSVTRAIAVDADTEDFQYVSRSFAGYDSGVYALMNIVSATCGIPVTLLFGRSPAGMNATGEADIHFFYDNVKAFQTQVLAHKLKRLLYIIMASSAGPLKGRVPETFDVQFNPLRQMSDLEKAQLRKTTAEADEIEINAGIITPLEARMSHHGGEAYDPRIEIDPTLTVIEEVQADPEDGEGGSGNNENQGPVEGEL